MPLVTSRQILQPARKRGYAVGAFNTSNLETTQAILAAAVAQHAPVIIQTTESAIAYAGMDVLLAMIKTMARHAPIPVAVHLDHGKHPAVVREGIRKGYTSVMIDASHLPLRQNIRAVRGIVRSAHQRGISVEAELGRIPGTEDIITSARQLLTDPAEAETFAKETRCDALAVAIGTAHGLVKSKGRPRLDFARLQEIAASVPLPLVLHGASHVDSRTIALANRYGARLRHAQGIPDSQVRRAVRLGISKINIDSDLRITFDAAVRKFLHSHPQAYDPREILGAATEAMQDVVERKIRLLGSAGRA